MAEYSEQQVYAEQAYAEQPVKQEPNAPIPQASEDVYQQNGTEQPAGPQPQPQHQQQHQQLSAAPTAQPPAGGRHDTTMTPVRRQFNAMRPCWVGRRGQVTGSVAGR